MRPDVSRVECSLGIFEFLRAPRTSTESTSQLLAIVSAFYQSNQRTITIFASLSFSGLVRSRDGSHLSPNTQPFISLPSPNIQSAKVSKSYTCENALFNEKWEEVKYVLHATRLSGIEESSLLFVRWIPFEVIAKVYCFIVPRVEEGVKSLCSATLVLCCCGLVSLYLCFLCAQNWIH